jgi:hypothetical protein
MKVYINDLYQDLYQGREYNISYMIMRVNADIRMYN